MKGGPLGVTLRNRGRHGQGRSRKAAAKQTTFFQLQEIVAMPTKQEIFDKIKSCLVEALGVEDDEVTPDATLIGDLGAESIDFLDIVFRLEKAFNIKVPRGELFPEDILTNSQYVRDGKVTSEGVTQLRERMPFADLDAFAANPNVKDFASQLTVQDMVRYVESKVEVAA